MSIQNLESSCFKKLSPKVWLKDNLIKLAGYMYDFLSFAFALSNP